MIRRFQTMSVELSKAAEGKGQDRRDGEQHKAKEEKQAQGYRAKGAIIEDIHSGHFDASGVVCGKIGPERRRAITCKPAFREPEACLSVVVLLGGTWCVRGR
jgi:hypothetical protein